MSDWDGLRGESVAAFIYVNFFYVEHMDCMGAVNSITPCKLEHAT